ncbi:MAG: hypothetical protein GY725_13195 [bacterium]|nr:hypothetical protein [bacterium]
MSRSWTLICTLVVLLIAPDSFANTVRYFGVWSYNENAPTREIENHALAERKLGYWVLSFDDDEAVISGTYHGADGTPWVSFWYAEADGRVYADLYRGPKAIDSEYIARKSTQLKDRKPNWPASRR